MANMRKNTMMERAELARAYINGGSAPYQAARQTGFSRVAEMQEAIRQLECKEAEDAAVKQNNRFGPGKAAKEDKPQQPVEEAKPAEPDKEVIYPFLPPGTMPKEIEKRPLYALHTRDISVKQIGTEKREVQIVLVEKRHTLSIPVEKLEETIMLLKAAWELEKKNG